MYRLLFIFIFLCSCATQYSQLGTDLNEVRPKLKDSYSFSFMYKGDKYFFAPEHFKQGNRECYLYLGFKNDKLTYSFSSDVFSKVEKAYADNDTPDIIKKKILDQLQSEKPTPNKCYEVGQGPPPDAGQGEAIMVLFFPLTAYFFVVDQVDKDLLHSISSSVELGMTIEQVPDFIRKRWLRRLKGKSSYYEYKQRQLGMIFYFENGKLDAWSQTYIRK